MMKFQHWHALEKGDLVDIVAPGMKPKKETIRFIADFLGGWGLRARIPKDLIGRDLICSNSKEYRLMSLKKALVAGDSKMIWCLRGGYGSIHLLNDLAKMKSPPVKIFMGLSDSTSLHSFLLQEWNWPTLHGANIDRFALSEIGEREKSRFYKVLFGQKSFVHYPIKPMNGAALKNKKILSSITGGNMITLQSSFGTKFELDANGKILFLEDIGERAYRIDRVFEHMAHLNLLTGAKAILFGQFTGGHESNGKSLVPRLLKQFAQAQKIPVFSGVQSGHGPIQHPVPFGTRAVIQGGLQPTIVIQTGVMEE